MKAATGRLCLLVIFVLGIMHAARTVYADDTVIRLRDNDAEMERAKTKARESLPQFWTKFRNPAPNEQNFSVKVEMPYSATNVEHIWVSNLEVRGGKIRATVNNEPKYVTYVKLGQRIEFEIDQISDWTYRKDGKIVGNFTMRPLLSRLQPAEAERYRAMLSEP